MKFFQFVLLMLIGTIAQGNSLDYLIENISQNNPRLMALQKWIDAQEAEARTGIFPDNPFIGYSHLLGNPDNIGNQQELEITMSFKLPWYYKSKSTIQNLEFRQKQLLADKEKREILHQTRTVYFHLVWLHKKESLLKARNQEAETLVSLMEEGFQRGEISRPVYDKSRIFAIGIHNDLQKTQSDINIYTQQLVQLNGGATLDKLIYDYPVHWVLPEFDTMISQVLQNNPIMSVAHLKVEQSESEVRHQRISNWPSFEAGYRSEAILNQRLQGFHAGITIPLWQNANRVQSARLNYDWSQANLHQQEIELNSEISRIHNEAAATLNNYNQIKALMIDQNIASDNLELLRSGHISFAEYIVDAGFIWDAQNQVLYLENTYFILLSKLNSML